MPPLGHSRQTGMSAPQDPLVRPQRRHCEDQWVKLLEIPELREIEPDRRRLEAHAAGGVRAAVDRGRAWLVERTAGGTRFDAAPIGFYFAKLWYYERAYPLVTTMAGLGTAVGTAASAARERVG